MKKQILFTTVSIFIVCSICIAIISCHKGNDTMANESLSTKQLALQIDFNSYYKTSKELSNVFWAACDKAYKSNHEAFLNSCNNNDFENFKTTIGLDSDFFDSFKEELLKTIQNIEKDHPGISELYKESPCDECSMKSLQRVGQVVTHYGGNSAVEINKLDPRDCIFICSMACMSIWELYIPCVLSCTELCMRLNH